MPKRTRTGKRLRVALFLAVGLAMTGLGLIGYGTHLVAPGSGWDVFGALELRSVDLRFSIRGTEEPPRDMVVVKVDDVTFSDLQIRQEYFRPLHARVIRRLKDDGAKVIVYDFQFTEPDPDEEVDNTLIEAVAYAGNVVLATTEVGPNGESNVFGGDDVVRDVARARVGNGNFPPDPGEYHRRMRYEMAKMKTLAVVTVERATGRPVRNFSTTWIDYHGPVETLETVSFSRVYQGKTPRGFFRDKIVIVGPWASTYQDLHPVSAGTDLMPGPEIQANAISTVRRGTPLNDVPSWLNVVLIIALGLFSPLVSLRLDLLRTIVLAIVVAAGYLVATQVAFEQGRVLSFVYPFGALVLSAVGSTAAHYVLAAFERERVRDVFSRFVPETVVEQVLARTDQDLRLGGESLVSTVMFTDVRGFTTFSESRTPAEVIDVLNVYLGEMTEAILEHGGTLVSYEGDGIMAVFGAPIEQLDHADRAVAASREILTERLPKFNAWMSEQGLGDGFKMGIGLNTGTVVSGNVGSERRLEYTAIGDTTNTASRLQGLTKGQSHLLFISDMTRELLQREVEDLVFIDEMEVRGRQSAVKIWSIEAASDAKFEERRAAG